MDIFTQNKSLSRIIVFLIILNLTLIGIFIWREFGTQGHLEKPPHKKITEILSSELKLSDKQVLEFERIREDFFLKEKQLETSIREARDLMNVEMFNKDINESLVKDLAERISEYEYNMEMLRLEQAKELKKICTPKQLEKFEFLVIEIRDYFQPEPQKKKK